MSTCTIPHPDSQLSLAHLQQIIELQSALSSADFNLTTFMKVLVERVGVFTPATGTVVELVEGEEMVYHAGSGAAAAFVGMRLKMATSISGLCVRTNAIAVSDDTSTDPRVDKAACEKINAASMIVVPLVRKNVAVGVLKVFSDRPKAFHESDIRVLQLLAGLLGGALGQQLEIHERQQLEERLRRMAQYDFLTEIPNRSLFYDRLQHAIARNKRNHDCLVLMYMDIDHFKSINDTYGHAAGDDAIREFAVRVKHVIRSSDTLARLGGDEFVLIAEQCKGKDEAQLIANKIIEAMRPPLFLAGQNIPVTISIGIALSFGQDIDTEKFVQQADKGLYQAKTSGRNNFTFASGEHNS